MRIYSGRGGRNMLLFPPVFRLPEGAHLPFCFVVMGFGVKTNYTNPRPSIGSEGANDREGLAVAQ